jgi:hypothetical protein
VDSLSLAPLRNHSDAVCREFVRVTLRPGSVSSRVRVVLRHLQVFHREDMPML